MAHRVINSAHGRFVGIDTVLMIQRQDAAGECEEQCFVAFKGLGNGLLEGDLAYGR